MAQIQFDLLHGYQDKAGTVHKHVVMRTPTGKDQIAVFRDQEMKELRASNVAIDLSGVTLDASGKVISGHIDPVKLQAYNTAQYISNTILFTQIVVSLGEITRPDREVLRNLETDDLDLMIAKYAELVTGEGEQTTAVPFGQGPSGS